MKLSIPMTPSLPITQTTVNWLNNAAGIDALHDRFVGGAMTFSTARRDGTGYEASLWFWDGPAQGAENGLEIRRLALGENGFSLDVWTDRDRRRLALSEDAKTLDYVQNVFRNFMCAHTASALSDALWAPFPDSRRGPLSARTMLGVATPINEITPVYSIAVFGPSAAAARALIAGLSNLMTRRDSSVDIVSGNGVFVFMHKDGPNSETFPDYVGALSIDGAGSGEATATVSGKNHEIRFSLTGSDPEAESGRILDGLYTLTPTTPA